MEEIDDKQAKIEALRRHFAPLIGERLSSFETAQIKLEGGWLPWLDLPIRLYFGRESLVSIAWSHFDKLFISNDKTINFSTEGSEARWVSKKIDVIRPALSGTLKSVELGRGRLSIGDQEIEIWTRLILEQDNGWLEVFNGLDENAFHFCQDKPIGEFIRCC
ncbi:hypothetical protein [Loktanella sp. Alg231-35]|uniref:hypothetical protein n=1 Tax=Loktanella sp. Alg231-35 TaxID=1922220 RepID=UPI000D551974|nr:hypothetical protein [Loktanella sp. Alg231-35]